MHILVKLGHHHGMCQASLKPIAKNALSLFTHGCGHLFLALKTTEVSGASRAFEDLSPNERAIVFIALSFVWYGFMRDSRRSFSVAVAFAMVHNIAQVFFLPTRFFFTHVLLAVLLNLAVRGLTRRVEDKDRYYSMEAALVDVPILLASFGEAITCDFFLVNYGGHVWFDMVVPAMFCVYFAVLIISPDEVDKTK